MSVVVSGVTKHFGAVSVLDGVDLAVGEREVIALLGPSGCGKTTLLRIIAGLEQLDRGEVTIGERRVAGQGVHVAPERRDIGLVFQDFALFPHLDIASNLSYGLRNVDAGVRARRVEEACARFGIGQLLRRLPDTLSGGQQQRVALARALVCEPRVLLMDEPFSNLDASLRRTLRIELRATLQAIGIATVFVTHDQEEALSLADRVAVMHAGRIAQLATPRVVYRQPASLEVARATGRVVVLRGEARGGQVTTALGVHPGGGPDGSVQVLARPEQLVPQTPGEGAAGRIAALDYTGPELELVIDVSGTTVSARVPLREPEGAWRIGDPIGVGVCGPLVWVAG